MGLIGSLILAIVPAALSDRHDEFRAVALSEANVISSLVASAAPLMVGWFAQLIGGWRMALGILAFAPVLLFVSLGKGSSSGRASAKKEPLQSNQPMPALFWVYWA